MAIEVAVSQCVLDMDVYPRHCLDQAHVATLVEALRAGAKFPPVILDKETFRVVDGFHRVTSTQKLYGDDAPIEAELREYESDAALFQEAMLYNARHGRRLTSYDRTRAILLARGMGISDEQTARTLAITREKLDQLVLTRTAIGPDDEVIPIKLTSMALAGKAITPPQIVANKAAGGMSLSFYVGQILNAISGGLVDLDNREVVSRLLLLHEKLGIVLNGQRMEEAA